MAHSEFGDMLQWLTGATLVTGFGLVVLAIVSSAVSYLVSSFVWRFVVANKRARKLHERRLQREQATATSAGEA